MERLPPALTSLMLSFLCISSSSSSEVSASTSSPPEPEPESLLLLYSNSYYKIIVRDLHTSHKIKTFTIRIADPTFIAMDYDSDAIYFTSDTTLYKLYLVDESGNRKISRNGELFVDTLVDHMEVAIYTATTSFGKIKGFIFDESTKMFYLFYPLYENMRDYFVKLDYRTGKEIGKGKIPFTGSGYVLHKSMLYATIRQRGDNYVLNISIDALEKDNYNWGWQWVGNKRDMSIFTIDEITSRLYYIENKNSIRLLNGNITNSPISSIEDRYVISDSEVTKNTRGLTVYGKVVVWSSYSWGKLYGGLLNQGMNFISKKNVHVLDKKSSSFKNVIIFKCRVNVTKDGNRTEQRIL